MYEVVIFHQINLWKISSKIYILFKIKTKHIHLEFMLSQFDLFFFLQLNSFSKRSSKITFHIYNSTFFHTIESKSGIFLMIFFFLSSTKIFPFYALNWSEANVFIEWPKIQKPNRDFHRNVDRSFSEQHVCMCSNRRERLKKKPFQKWIILFILFEGKFKLLFPYKSVG